MIDTHCHLLPRTDDGPPDLQVALALARGLVAAGVETVVCTPHFSRRYPTGAGWAAARRDELELEFAATRIRLRLMLAAEISAAAMTEASDEELRERRIGNGHVIIELDPDTPAGILQLATERLGELNLRPVFAHPERCRALRDQPRLLESARSAGAKIQVVARSIDGRGRGRTGEAAWRLLEAGLVDLLASDSHRPSHADGLADARREVERRYGSSLLDALTRTNPAAIIPDSRVEEGYGRC